MKDTLTIASVNPVSASTLATELTMSSLEIAELTGKLHKNVIRDIEKMLNDVGIDRLKFELVYLDAKGEKRKCYNLPKDLTITLIAGYRADLRLKIVRRWMELESGVTSAPAIEKPTINVVFREYMDIASLLPFDSNQKILMSARGTYNRIGRNPLEEMGVPSLPAPTNDHYLTPTELGKKHGNLSAQKINALLRDAGLQTKETWGWQMTAKGSEYGRLFDTTRKNGNGSQAQLKWKESVLDLI